MKDECRCVRVENSVKRLMLCDYSTAIGVTRNERNVADRRDRALGLRQPVAGVASGEDEREGGGGV